MTLAAVSLDDKYALDSGRVFLTGVQALVRLPMMQRRRDEQAGLNTASFISGYRGSPLAGYDQQLWQARRFLQKHHIHFEPGVNEDMAATAVWGSQQVNLGPEPKYDGVFSIWYGKGPGVDRSGDVMRHANSAGSAANGGVLALIGDDHNAVSSTVAHQSEHAMMGWMMPMLYPANVQEYLDFGLIGWALSRYSGCWVGLKCVTEVVESSASVYVDPHRVDLVHPGFAFPEGGLNIRWPDDRWSQETRLHQFKIPAALAFAEANGVDRTTLDGPGRRVGIVTTGKSWLDVMQALDDLGIDAAEAGRMGLAVYKVGMPWPLEPEGVRRFAEGLDEVLVVEEKRTFIEAQLKDQLYNWPADRRPRVFGKADADGTTLLPGHGELSPSIVARAIHRRFGALAQGPRMADRIADLDRQEREVAGRRSGIERVPYFCSGCPHNTSTKVPEGSRAMAGIGCHFMALSMNRSTGTFTQMGGEGAPWIGQQPFTHEKHVFANLGDGTYYHSGLLAIRAAIAAKVNITYKILYNDAVAMTGGQPAEGGLLPWQIARQVADEGAARVVVVSDEPDKYPIGTDWPAGTDVRHRDDLDAVQRDLREVAGVTVLIYDQTCAAEKRRRRKRGTFPDPDRRVIINELVCEGCGDCSVKSNCVSVEPLETEYGRKRQINQSACNKDFSCIKGFCPSFVTVSGARPRAAKAAASGDLEQRLADLPAPQTVAVDERPFNLVVTGIGGTGVITVGALLGMAAHLEGKGVTVLDFTGLAQKNGAVLSHVRIGASPEALHAPRVGDGAADLLLGCDMVVAAGEEAMRKIEPGSTAAIVNSHVAPTAAFTLDPNYSIESARLKKLLRETAGDNRTEFVDATRLATALLGDSIATNLFMLGYAVQRGLLPVSLEAIDRAIELNGVAIDMNRRTFALGRLAAVDPGAVERAAKPQMVEPSAPVAETFEESFERRVRHLTGYQDAAWAERYAALVREVERAERERTGDRGPLTDAVMRNAFRLMAYKDEYEVARLYSDGSFRRQLESQLDGTKRMTVHLAPPLLAPRDPVTGEARKREFGPWIFTAFRWLAKLKHLRGTRWDVFGYTEERRTERQLIEEYRATVAELVANLSPENQALAAEIARVPEQIRGFGHVKERNLATARARGQALLAQFRNPAAQRAAAAE